MKSLPLLLLSLLLLSCQKPLPPAPATPPEVLAEAPSETFSEVLEEPAAQSYHKGTFYYRAPEMDALVPATCSILNSKNAAEEIRSLVGKLGRAPDEGEGLPIWSEQPKVRDVFTTKDGLVVIDFSKDFLERISTGATGESYMISSLLQAVFFNFPAFNRVHILVQGEVSESFLGHIDIEFPLTRKNIRYPVVAALTIPDPSPTPSAPIEVQQTAPVVSAPENKNESNAPIQ